MRSRATSFVVQALTTLLLIVVALAGVWWFSKTRAARERAQWKGTALERLAALTITNEAIRQELRELKAGPTPNVDFGWAHENVLLMTNGEFIVYAYRHGQNNGFVDHLFLGRGSDGRWLYSTFHFCRSMTMVHGDPPPGSITEFAKTYSAREFDGKSAECLKRTWSGFQVH